MLRSLVMLLLNKKQAENEAKRANKRADEAEKQQDEMARMTTYDKLLY